MGTVYLIRHGQASFGAEDYDRLSETGLRQSRVLGRALGRLSAVARVVCGEMMRHEQTARACLEAMGREPSWDADPDWNEFDHEQVILAFRPRYEDRGVLVREMKRAGDPRRAFEEMFEAAVRRWIGGEHDADYVEAWPAFRARCRGALERLVEGLARSADAIVFTSAGPITAVCRELLQIPDERALELNWELTNCGITRLACRRRGIRLVSFNGFQHFVGDEGRMLTRR